MRNSQWIKISEIFAHCSAPAKIITLKKRTTPKLFRDTIVMHSFVHYCELCYVNKMVQYYYHLQLTSEFPSISCRTTINSHEPCYYTEWHHSHGYSKRISIIECFPSTGLFLTHNGSPDVPVNMIASDHDLHKKQDQGCCNLIFCFDNINFDHELVGGGQFKRKHCEEKPAKISSVGSRGIAVKVCPIENLMRQGMGTRMAPSYANLFMGRLETHLLEVAAKKPTIWWRYIDDVFTIWPHGEGCLDQFLEHLNNMHPFFKFIAEWSYKSVSFPDVKVS